jgi:flagellar biosynthesis protein FlhF
LVIVLVGPTGAGKTTTIAKLAAHPRVFGRRGVGLLTLDTYRVGAVDQLRTYAGIAELPLEVVHETAELAPALRRLRSRRVILVDTPGRSPRRRAETDLLQHWLFCLHPDEIHLVLPAGTRPDLARALIARHVAAGATHLLATKLDEISGDGTLFDLAAAARLPMRWVTDGQEVPFDLRAARHALLAALKIAAAKAPHGPPLGTGATAPAPVVAPPPPTDVPGDPLFQSLRQVADALGGEARVLESLRDALHRAETLA